MQTLRDIVSSDFFTDWAAAVSSSEELRACVETRLSCGDVSRFAYVTVPVKEQTPSKMVMHFGFSQSSRRSILSGSFETKVQDAILRGKVLPLWASVKMDRNAQRAERLLTIPLVNDNVMTGYFALTFYGVGPIIAQEDLLNIQRVFESLHHTYTALSRPAVAELTELTAIEIDVIRWAALGKSDAVIANILAVTPQSIDRHMRSIFKKLDVSDRIKAGLRAISLGLI